MAQLAFLPPAALGTSNRAGWLVNRCHYGRLKPSRGISRAARLRVGVKIFSCASEDIERGDVIQDGLIAPNVENGVVGVFGVEDEDGVLRHVGISRDCRTSLARALARQPELAHRYRLRRFGRPSRAALEEVRSEWAEHATDQDETWAAWEVDSEERQELADDPKLLKKACRVRQAVVEQALKERGLTQMVLFAPKLKEKGILDVASKRTKVPDAI